MESTCLACRHSLVTQRRLLGGPEQSIVVSKIRGLYQHETHGLRVLPFSPFAVADLPTTPSSQYNVRLKLNNVAEIRAGIFGVNLEVAALIQESCLNPTMGW